MKNSEQPISPIVNSDGFPSSGKSVITPEGKLLIGLTKREYFAGLAMQGMLANSMRNDQGVKPFSLMNASEIANEAVRQADELLAELDKQTA